MKKLNLKSFKKESLLLVPASARVAYFEGQDMNDLNFEDPESELFEPTEKTARQIHILLLVPDGTTIDNSERMTNE